MSPQISTPMDEATRLEPMATYNAAYNTGTLDLGAGAASNTAYQPGGAGEPVQLVANVSALSNGVNGQWSHKLQQAADNATWTDVTPAVNINLSMGAGVSNVIGGLITMRYVRRVVLLTGGNGTQSITNESFLSRNVRI